MIVAGIRASLWWYCAKTEAHAIITKIPAESSFAQWIIFRSLLFAAIGYQKFVRDALESLDPWVGPAQGIDSTISKKRSLFHENEGQFQTFHLNN
jgi:hypothetical protein